MSKNLIQEVRRRANKLSVSEADFYHSNDLKTYLDTLSGTLVGSYAKHPRISVVSDATGNMTARTDGNLVIINWASNLVQFFADLSDRFTSFLGFFYHEHAHIIYNDFDGEAKELKKLEGGQMPGEEPVFTESEDIDSLNELVAAIADPDYKEIFVPLYHTLCNIVIDPHDEEKMIADYGSLAREAIYKTREALRADEMTLESNEALVETGDITPLMAMDNLLLSFLRFGRVICLSEEREEKSPFMEVLRRISAHAENARWTDSTKERFTELNYVVHGLWPFIRDELQKPESAQSQNQSKPSKPSKERIEQVANQLAQSAQSAPQTAAPTGHSSARAKADAKAEGSVSPQMGPINSGSEEAINGLLSQMLGQIATQMAERELEKEQAQAIRQEAKETLSQTSSHVGIPVSVVRRFDMTGLEEKTYHAVMNEVGPYSKRLQKKMLEIMRDMKEGELLKHRAFGKIIRPEDAYRADERFFANKKAPRDLPDMALSVLIDHSGSMLDGRIESSMRAAILLHDFATGIGIPVAVSGHRADDYKVEYISYTDFDRYGTKDALRLTQMSPNGCNRDGAAIEIAAARLNKRPEQLKLLVIISDGKPNHSGYGGEAAMEDIRSIVKKYHRKGIVVYGAAIGDDRDVIQSIYGEGFLDISDLSTFPKVLTKLVQKKLLTNIY